MLLIWRGGGVQDASSPLSKALIKNQNIAFSPTIDRHLLLIDVGAATLQSIRGDSSIQNYLESRIAAPGHPNFTFPLIGIFALLLAPILGNLKNRHIGISILYLLTAASCAFKLSTLCKACGETGSAEYWLALVGSVCTATVAGIALSGLTQRITFVAVSLSTCIAAFQVAAWTVEPSTSCFACLMIVLFNCLTLGLLGFPDPDAAAQSRFSLPTRQCMFGGVAIGMTLVAFALYDHQSQGFKSIGKIDGRPTGSLVGQNLRFIARQNRPSRVVLVTSAGCDACKEAEEFVSANQYSWVMQVDINRMGSLPYTPKAVPTLLILNEKSIVTSEITGRSSDPLWIKSFESVISSNRPANIKAINQ